MYNNDYNYANEALSYPARREKIMEYKKCAESIILLARKKGEMIIQQTENCANEIRRKAKEEGYDEGFKLGREEGKIKGEEEFNNKTGEILSIMEEVKNKYMKEVENLLDSLEPGITKLALEIAEKVVLKHIDEDDEFIIRTVRDAFKNLLNRDSVILSVYPAEVEKLSKRKDEIVSASDALVDLDITSGETVERGGCLVSSSTGIIDARIESKLEEVNDLINN